MVIETKREDFYFQLFDENLKNQRTAGFDAGGNCQSPEEPPDQLYRRRGRAAAVGFMGLQIKQVEITDMMSTEALFRTTYQKYLQKNLDFPKPLYIRGLTHASDRLVRRQNRGISPAGAPAQRICGRSRCVRLTKAPFNGYAVQSRYAKPAGKCLRMRMSDANKCVK